LSAREATHYSISKPWRTPNVPSVRRLNPRFLRSKIKFFAGAKSIGAVE